MPVDNLIVIGLPVDNLIGLGLPVDNLIGMVNNLIGDGLPVNNLIGNGLPVDNLIGDGLPVDNLCFKVAFFSFELLTRSTRQTKSFSGNKADKSTGFSTGDFTVKNNTKVPYIDRSVNKKGPNKIDTLTLRLV